MVTIFSQGNWLTGGELQGQEDAREAIPTGFKGVDALLPAGGLRRGSLVEWLAGSDAQTGDVASGTGAVSLALAIACRLAKPGSRTASNGRSGGHAGRKTILVVDRGGWFHPPAVMPWLDDSRQLVVARPSHDDDEIWAIDQALRCRGVAAVVAWPRGMSREFADVRQESRFHGTRRLSAWTTAMRRWQLAARSSGSIGLFVRPAAAIREPSWAEARFAVSPAPGSPSPTRSPSLSRASSLPRSPSLSGSPSLPSGTLTQRRLMIERVGGAWNGGLSGQATEIVLDLARGCESPTVQRTDISLPLPRRRVIARRSADGSQAELTRGGVACRAS